MFPGTKTRWIDRKIAQRGRRAEVKSLGLTFAPRIYSYALRQSNHQVNMRTQGQYATQIWLAERRSIVVVLLSLASFLVFAILAAIPFSSKDVDGKVTFLTGLLSLVGLTCLVAFPVLYGYFLVKSAEGWIVKRYRNLLRDID